MYNKEVKERFIDDYLSSREIAKTAVESVFTASERMEVLYDKDICNFTRPEIINFYKSLRAKSKERLSMTNSILKAYKVWTIVDAGICFDETPYFDTFTVDDFKGYISKNILENKYIGEETLRGYLKEIYNPQDQLLLVLLYNGVRGRQLCEIINLHRDQVQGNVLHLCTGKEIEVDDKVIDLIHETDNTFEYYSYGENTRRWELFGDNVFKVTKGVRSTSMASAYHRFTVKMVNFQNLFDNPEITISRVETSGMLNAIKNGIETHGMSLEEYVGSEHIKPILERYEFKRPPTKIISLFEEFMEYLV